MLSGERASLCQARLPEGRAGFYLYKALMFPQLLRSAATLGAPWVVTWIQRKAGEVLIQCGSA